MLCRNERRGRIPEAAKQRAQHAPGALDMTTWLRTSTPTAADLGIGHVARPRSRTARRPWWRVLAFWIARSKQRRVLREIAALSPHILDDIGVTQRQALDEVGRPFWR